MTTKNKDLDQFYTNPDVARICIEYFVKHFQFDEFDSILEPSAGTGNIYTLLPQNKRVGIDLEPKYDGVKLMDFFDFTPDKKKWLVIGNPPFGKVSSKAVQFFNHAATFADVIAFIIPRTFKRVSLQNQLDLNFHLVQSYDLPIGCFTPKMSAKCCFQIWEYREIKRDKIILPKSHKDFTFLKLGPINEETKQPTVPVGADFAIKAYGSNCGEIQYEMDSLSPKSWHWIKSNIDIKTLETRFISLDYSISRDTVRQDSIGQQELILLYMNRYN